MNLLNFKYYFLKVLVIWYLCIKQTHKDILKLILKIKDFIEEKFFLSKTS